MIHRMLSCASCGAQGVAPGQACPRCGAKALPDLELDLKARPAPRPPAPKSAAKDEISMELAVDPRALMQERARAEGPPPVAVQTVPSGDFARGAAAGSPGALAAAPTRALVPAAPAGGPMATPGPVVGDVAFDARLLADYGEPPRHWLLSPLYAWRVLRRQRELKAALVGRREEATRTAGEVEEALVAFAERVRPTAEKQSGFAQAVEDLRRAEELLRSRDRVLAAEQDGQNARLAQVDARLAKLEEELTRAQAEEQAIAAELAGAQGALAREEAKLKRAEIELRAAQQREAAAGGGTGA